MTPQTAYQMRTAAHQLAAMVEHEMQDVAPHEKCEFRLLSCELLRWADEIDPEHAAALPPPEPDLYRLLGLRS